MQTFFGKYRGEVINNVDPEQRGRLQVCAPAVLGAGRLSWALPCVPYAGKKVGFFALPPKGASIWVEFEGGNPDYPIWSGCFWDKTEDVPAQPAVPETKVFQTETLSFTLNEGKEQAVTLKVKTPNGALQLVFDKNGITLGSAAVTLSITPQMITLKNGSSTIELSTASVSINKGALEVM